jgi:hypothetical protein
LLEISEFLKGKNTAALYDARLMLVNVGFFVNGNFPWKVFGASHVQIQIYKPRYAVCLHSVVNLLLFPAICLRLTWKMRKCLSFFSTDLEGCESTERP